MDSFINLSNFPKLLPYAQLFWQGILVTVLLSIFTVVIGFVLALILALMRLSNFCPLRFLALDKNGHRKQYYHIEKYKHYKAFRGFVILTDKVLRRKHQIH